jgi:hypothetical protein
MKSGCLNKVENAKKKDTRQIKKRKEKRKRLRINNNII